MWASPLPAKSREAYASLGHSGHLPGVRDQNGMLSAFSVERCPPSPRNAVRHQRGTASGIARNTHHTQAQRSWARLISGCQVSLSSVDQCSANRRRITRWVSRPVRRPPRTYRRTCRSHRRAPAPHRSASVAPLPPIVTPLRVRPSFKIAAPAGEGSRCSPRRARSVGGRREVPDSAACW